MRTDTPSDRPLVRRPEHAEVLVSAEGEAGSATTTGWVDLGRAADRLAAVLAARGAGPGAAVVLPGTTRYETLVAVLAAWRCGAAVSLVPAGHRRDAAAVAADLGDRALGPLAAEGPVLIVAEAAVLDELGRDGPTLPGAQVLELTGAVPPPADGGAGPAGPGGPAGQAEPAAWRLVDGDDRGVAVYQATSGTSGDPRLVPVTWRMLRANVEALRERLEVGAGDSFVSWMPLFHDMGLVLGVALPARLGAPLCLLPPAAFARSPGRFLELVAGRRGTISASPTTGVAMLHRALERESPVDLSSLRAVVCGAEMIDVGLCERAIEAGRRHGLRPDVFAFGYGLAEGTLAVSLRRPDLPASAEEPVDGAGGAGDAHWVRPRSGRGVARTGPPVHGTEVRITDPRTGDLRPAGAVGEIEVRGPSVMDAYVGRTPAASGIRPAGWLRTGDLGYLAGPRAGELVVVGRIKDIVVVGGRNLIPDEVERVVGALPGIRAGRVAAVQVVGRAGEALAVVAERSAGLAGAEVDARAVRTALQREMGIAPEAVALVPGGTLLKTTSGKLRRRPGRDVLVRQDVAGETPS